MSPGCEMIQPALFLVWSLVSSLFLLCQITYVFYWHFHMVFVCQTALTSTLSFAFPFLLLVLGSLSPFPSFFRWELSSLVTDLFSFLLWAFSATLCPLHTLEASPKLSCIVLFSFSYFYFPHWPYWPKWCVEMSFLFASFRTYSVPFLLFISSFNSLFSEDIHCIFFQLF